LPSECRVYGLKQNCVNDWLEQEPYGSLFKRSIPDALFHETGNEDDRNRLTAKFQFLLKIESRHARHSDVEDQTAGLAHAIGGEKLFRGGKRAGGEAELPQ